MDQGLVFRGFFRGVLITIREARRPSTRQKSNDRQFRLEIYNPYRKLEPHINKQKIVAWLNELESGPFVVEKIRAELLLDAPKPYQPPIKDEDEGDPTDFFEAQASFHTEQEF